MARCWNGRREESKAWALLKSFNIPDLALPALRHVPCAMPSSQACLSALSQMIECGITCCRV